MHSTNKLTSFIVNLLIVNIKAHRNLPQWTTCQCIWQNKAMHISPCIAPWEIFDDMAYWFLDRSWTKKAALRMCVASENGRRWRIVWTTRRRRASAERCVITMRRSSTRLTSSKSAPWLIRRCLFVCERCVCVGTVGLVCRLHFYVDWMCKFTGHWFL